MAAELGVVFRWNTEIKAMDADLGRITSVQTSAGRIAGDAFVLAMGSYSPILARPFGMRLPVYPVKGYSITVPIVNEDRAPVSTVMDETFKIAITRLGDRIRVGGMAEISGFNNHLHPRRQATLTHSVEDLFGGAGDQSKATFWSGLRPMTPDGTPLVGRSTVPNLYLNTGHGTLGWTMAAGSARVVADMVSGRVAEIDAADLGYTRYQRRAKQALPAAQPVAAE
jgi:D-amino-acid dehydrogenase